MTADNADMVKEMTPPDMIYAPIPIGGARKTYFRTIRPTDAVLRRIERVTGRVVYNVAWNSRDGFYEIDTHPLGWTPKYEWRKRRVAETPIELDIS